MLKRVISLILVAGLAVTVFAGCGKKDLSGLDSGIAGKYGKGEISYPIQTEGEVLRIWIQNNPNVLKTCSDFNDTLFATEIQKQTGINVEYLSAPVGDTGEAFNLLFSSNDLPDIICHDWKKFSGGGPDGAIDSGYLFVLDDYMADYAPNFTKKLNENPDYYKSARSLNGHFYSFGGITHDVPVYGPIIRQDWLDDLGLKKPETIDEWYITLKAFKEKKGADAPLAFQQSFYLYSSGVFESAFKTSHTFYRDGDTVKFGPMEQGYKDFVKEMTKWYSEGLIDRNVASSDGEALDAKILNDRTGAMPGYISSGIGRYMTAKSPDSPMRLEAVPYPVTNKGDDRAVYGKTVGAYSDYAAISATSQNKELAMRYLDYGYTDKGILTYIFGIEGDSYVMENGKPKYTDMVLNNPDGLSISEALGLYCGSVKGGSSILTNDAYLQQLKLDVEFQAAETWPYNDDHCMPKMLMNSDQQKEYTDIMTEVETYVSETTLGIICGHLPLSTLDTMNAQLKEMNIDRALEIMQEAYNTYNK